MFYIFLGYFLKSSLHFLKNVTVFVTPLVIIRSIRYVIKVIGGITIWQNINRQKKQ